MKPKDAAYQIILKNNLLNTLCGLFRLDEIETVDLKEKAADYLLSTGLTEADLAALSAKLEQ